jgi:hypothetical protein
MRISAFLAFGLAMSFAARADFSYTATAQSSGGLMASAAPSQPMRHLIKGDKMKIDMGENATIVDLGAQTITHINKRDQTYSVTPFSELAGPAAQTGMDVKVDVKETGQRKTIAGYDCHEVVMTMEADAPARPGQPAGGMKMQVTADVWLSPGVPGYQELRAFHQRLVGQPVWSAMMGGGKQQAPMVALQRKMAAADGAPILSVIKIGAAGAATPEMVAQRAKLEEMKRQGGAQAQMAERVLSMMGGGGSLVEITSQSSDFSTAAIPDSEFAPPAGYKKVARQ